MMIIKMLLVNKMKMLLLKTKMHDNILVPLTSSMTNWTFTMSKPLDDTVRTWFIHSRTAINKATRGAGIKL